MSQASALMDAVMKDMADQLNIASNPCNVSEKVNFEPPQSLKSIVTVANNVRELLECPVCLNWMCPPIYQCSNGHTLCSGCKMKVPNRCPTCRNELGNIRCLSLEKLADSIELPCNYKNSGCPGVYPCKSKLKHESECIFRPYNCPVTSSKCKVVGNIAFLIAHLKDEHQAEVHNGGTFSHPYVKLNPHEVQNETWVLTIFSCFGQYFCLHFESFKLGTEPVYIAFLQFMGEECEAKKYNYSLKVKGDGRKMVWEGVPRSIRDSPRKVRDNFEGLLIQKNVALFFTEKKEEDFKMWLSGSIWKRMEHKKVTGESRQLSMVNLISSVSELLECPVCLNRMYPPIHQCSNGHALCSACKPKVHNRCPVCRHEFGNIRCLALEKVADSLDIPCNYKSLGCPGVYPYSSKLKHESKCTFRPYNCPCTDSECKVVGSIPFLVAHLKDQHKAKLYICGSTFSNHYVNLNPHGEKNATWTPTVFSCFGQYFCLHFEAFKLGTESVYIAFLQFMGEDKEAKKYNCSLEVEGNGRKMVWEGVPRSIRDSPKKVRDSFDGLLIQKKYITLIFFEEDKDVLKMRVTGRIWKL